MPQATLAAVADRGVIRGDTVRRFYSAARQVFDDIAAVGVDNDDVVHVLANEGLRKFEESWARVTDEVGGRLRATGPHFNATASLPPVRTQA